MGEASWKWNERESVGRGARYIICEMTQSRMIRGEFTVLLNKCMEDNDWSLPPADTEIPYESAGNTERFISRASLTGVVEMKFYWNRGFWTEKTAWIFLPPLSLSIFLARFLSLRIPSSVASIGSLWDWKTSKAVLSYAFDRKETASIKLVVRKVFAFSPLAP